MSVDISKDYNSALQIFFSSRLPLLIVFVLLVLALELIRSFSFHTVVRKHLFKNMLLALLPFAAAIGIHLIAQYDEVQYRFLGFTLGAIWLVLFPNSVYLVTEVHHFRDKTAVPLWFDTVGILSYVCVGILLSSYSLLSIHSLLYTVMPVSLSWLIVISCMFLASLGVYAGRVLRFNSWDIFSKPRSLVDKLSKRYTARPVEVISATLLLWILILFFYILDSLTIYDIQRISLTHS